MVMTLGMWSDSPCRHDQSKNQQVKGREAARMKRWIVNLRSQGYAKTVLQSQIEDVVKGMKSQAGG